MGEIDRSYEFQDEPQQMSYEQVEYMESRIFNIMSAIYTGFGMDGLPPDDDSLIWSQMMLGDLLSDLRSDLPAPSYRNADGSRVYEDLQRYALMPITAIAAAPNLARHQKTKLLTDYPNMLYVSEFTFTKYGARARVARELRIARYNATDNRHEYNDLLKAVEHHWRQERVEKTLDFFGELYKRNPHLAFFRMM